MICASGPVTDNIIGNATRIVIAGTKTDFKTVGDIFFAIFSIQYTTGIVNIIGVNVDE